jgi:hypothetical protein
MAFRTGFAGTPAGFRSDGRRTSLAMRLTSTSANSLFEN